MRTWFSSDTLFGLLCAVLLLCAWPDGAIAQGFGGGAPPPAVGEPADTCTDGPGFITQPTGSSGLVSTVAGVVTGLISNLTNSLFNTIQGNPDFSYAIGAILSVYIALYGMFFALGMVRANAYDFCVRVLKIGALAFLAGPSAWSWMNTFVIPFFNTGYDDMIREVTKLAVGTMGSTPIGGPTNSPLSVIDQAVSTVVSANMGVHLLAMLFTPPYGLIYLILVAIALWAFTGMLLTGIWVYLTALVLRGLLFGVAPIFIACLLFDRTHHLFRGWLNQVFSACLQPIMLFTFFSFFVLMAQKYVDQIIAIPVCWTESSESLQGTPFNVHFWRFTVHSASSVTGFEPYGGQWDIRGAPNVPGSPTFPVPFMIVIMFLAVSELGRRFTQVVLMVARDLSASGVDLSGMQNAFSDLMPTQNSATNASVVTKTVNEKGLIDTLKDNFSNALGLRKGSNSTNK